MRTFSVLLYRLAIALKPWFWLIAEHILSPHFLRKKSNKPALKTKLHFHFTSSFLEKQAVKYHNGRHLNQCCFHGDAKLVCRSERVEGTQGEGPTSAVESSHRVSNN